MGKVYVNFLTEAPPVVIKDTLLEKGLSFSVSGDTTKAVEFSIGRTTQSIGIVDERFLAVMVNLKETTEYLSYMAESWS